MNYYHNKIIVYVNCTTYEQTFLNSWKINSICNRNIMVPVALDMALPVVGDVFVAKGMKRVWLIVL